MSPPWSSFPINCSTTVDYCRISFRQNNASHHKYYHIYLLRTCWIRPLQATTPDKGEYTRSNESENVSRLTVFPFLAFSLHWDSTEFYAIQPKITSLILFLETIRSDLAIRRQDRPDKTHPTRPHGLHPYTASLLYYLDRDCMNTRINKRESRHDPQGTMTTRLSTTIGSKLPTGRTLVLVVVKNWKLRW